MDDNTDDKYIKTYICTLGYWSPDLKEEKDINKEYEQNHQRFINTFNEKLREDIVNTISDMEIFEKVNFKFHDTLDCEHALELYDVDQPMNFIPFNDIIIECLLNPERYKLMINKNKKDEIIVEKLRNKIENALFESDFRDLRVKINLNSVNEFRVKGN